MCLQVYKGIYRGAYALAVSYMAQSQVWTISELRPIIGTYLNDNGIKANFTEMQHRLVVDAIIRAGIETHQDRMTMDEAIAYLSSRLEIIL